MNVRLTRRARRDLDGLDGTTRRRMLSTLRDLADNPRMVDLRKLEGEEALYRVRMGDYRAIVQIGPETDTAYVLRVVHRREAYR